MKRIGTLILTTGLLAAACGGATANETTSVGSDPPTSTTVAAIADAAMTQPAAPATTVAAATKQPAPTVPEASTVATDELPPPVAYGLTVLVAGREDCRLNPPARMPTQTTDSDGTAHFRNGRFECTVVNNDPRIAGTAYYTLDLDRWATAPDDTAQVMWGTIHIENEGGAWDADYVGVYTSEYGDVFTALFTGTGSYEGLSYYQWAVETFGSSWPTKGLIFPGTVSVP